MLFLLVSFFFFFFNACLILSFIYYLFLSLILYPFPLSHFFFFFLKGLGIDAHKSGKLIDSGPPADDSAKVAEFTKLWVCYLLLLLFLIPLSLFSKITLKNKKQKTNNKKQKTKNKKQKTKNKKQKIG